MEECQDLKNLNSNVSSSVASMASLPPSQRGPLKVRLVVPGPSTTWNQLLNLEWKGRKAYRLATQAKFASSLDSIVIVSPTMTEQFRKKLSLTAYNTLVLSTETRK